MNVLRRGGAVLLLVCSALGVALCLGGVVGVWVAHQPAKELVSDTLDTLDSYLTLANQTVGQVRDRTTRLRTTLADARQELAAGANPARAAITTRVSAALQEGSATLASLQQMVQGLSASLATVNRTLAHLARLPGVVPPSLPNDLQALEGSLATIGDRLGTVGATLSNASLQVSSFSERSGAVVGELQDLDERLDQWTARLATAQTALLSAKGTASTAVDMASVGLSLLLVLFGVGQVSLGLQAWRWLQMGSLGASSGVVTPVGARAS